MKISLAWAGRMDKREKRGEAGRFVRKLLVMRVYIWVAALGIERKGWIREVSWRWN